MTGLTRRKSFELLVEGQEPFHSPVSFKDISLNSLKTLKRRHPDSQPERRLNRLLKKLTACSPFFVGKPVITSLTKRRADEGKYKVLTCEADGMPEPSFQWSVNGTDVSLQTRGVRFTASQRVVVFDGCLF